MPQLLRRTDKFDFGLHKEFGAAKFDIDEGTAHGFMADAFGGMDFTSESQRITGR